MKIGILTLPFNNNYGGLLQCFALQTFLKELGHDVIIIKRAYPKQSNIKTKIIRIIKKISGKTNKYRKQTFPMIFFERSHFTETRPFTNPIQLEELPHYHLDTLIVGSDQVWRFDYTKEHFAEYFLDFAERWKINRIAFAASFGIKSWTLNTEQTDRIKKLASLFNRISVRESSGINLCQQYLDYQAVHLLDPTFLLSASEYRKLYRTKPHVKTQDTIASYLLDSNEAKKNAIKMITNVTGLKNVFIGRNPKTGNWQSVEEWLQHIDEAKFIITDSFHGIVFSIIFDKPFVLINNTSRGAERFISLSETFGFNQFYDCTEQFSVKHINHIDKKLRERIIKENKKASIHFLAL